MIRSHHERWDGSGYPDLIGGPKIPLGGRIFAVADTLDVIIGGRPYCPARSIEEARAELTRCSGGQFDPEVVDVFLTVPEEEWISARQDVTSRYEKRFPVLSVKPGAKAKNF